jgi:hypothetical protein
MARRLIWIPAATVAALPLAWVAGGWLTTGPTRVAAAVGLTASFVLLGFVLWAAFDQYRPARPARTVYDLLPVEGRIVHAVVTNLPAEIGTVR